MFIFLAFQFNTGMVQTVLILRTFIVRAAAVVHAGMVFYVLAVIAYKSHAGMVHIAFILTAVKFCAVIAYRITIFILLALGFLTRMVQAFFIDLAVRICAAFILDTAVVHCMQTGTKVAV